MKKKAIFTSQALIEEIDYETNGNQKNVFIEDMVTGKYYRCYGVTFDDDGDLILRVKSVDDVLNGTKDLYE